MLPPLTADKHAAHSVSKFDPPSNVLAVILSVAGAFLSAEEAALFKDSRPYGFILFARNCENPAQLRKLCADLRACVGFHCPILVDQEGGRVQRLKPPHWRAYPAARHFGHIVESDAPHGEDKALSDLRYTTLQMAEDLVDVGIDVNCAPTLDVLCAGAHDVIGDRSFGSDPALCGRLGLSVCRHYLAAGIIPVMKHLPGHGRAECDSHKDLPRVSADISSLEEIDFEPFRIVAQSDVGRYVWAMAAHIIYDMIDPEHPSSVSPTIIEQVIRKQIGFEGILLSDDISMEALSAYGGVVDRAMACLESGCDFALYCAGKLDEMAEIVKIVPNIGEKTRERLQFGAELGSLTE